MSNQEAEQRALIIVRSMTQGERIGYNNGLHWAARWVEDSAKANGDSAVAAFAQNMGMSIRAHCKKLETNMSLYELPEKVRRKTMQITLDDIRKIAGNEVADDLLADAIEEQKLSDTIEYLLKLDAHWKRQLSDLLRRSADDDDARHPA